MVSTFITTLIDFLFLYFDLDWGGDFLSENQ
jgi:hypothetical protein